MLPEQSHINSPVGPGLLDFVGPWNTSFSWEGVWCRSGLGQRTGVQEGAWGLGGSLGAEGGFLPGAGGWGLGTGVRCRLRLGGAYHRWLPAGGVAGLSRLSDCHSPTPLPEAAGCWHVCTSHTCKHHPGQWELQRWCWRWGQCTEPCPPPARVRRDVPAASCPWERHGARAGSLSAQEIAACELFLRGPGCSP